MTAESYEELAERLKRFALSVPGGPHGALAHLSLDAARAIRDLEAERDAAIRERDEALAVAEGPSSLRDLVAAFHERGGEIVALQAQVAALRARLEVDHYYDANGNRVETVPGDWTPDGIECRDATIDTLQAQLHEKDGALSITPAEARRIINYLHMAMHPGRTPFIKENGVSGEVSPWVEFRQVAARIEATYDARRAAQARKDHYS